MLRIGGTHDAFAPPTEQVLFPHEAQDLFVIHADSLAAQRMSQPPIPVRGPLLSEPMQMTAQVHVPTPPLALCAKAIVRRAPER